VHRTANPLDRTDTTSPPRLKQRRSQREEYNGSSFRRSYYYYYYYELPVWVDDTHLDVDWIRKHTELPGIIRCSVEDISNETRRGEKAFDGATLRLSVELEDKKDKKKTMLSLVVKQVPSSSGRPLSQQLGLAREALFYYQLESDLHSNKALLIPEILCSWGNMKTGAKVIIMEDLEGVAVDSGVWGLFWTGQSQQLEP
jgi:hypothetical protein